MLLFAGCLGRDALPDHSHPAGERLCVSTHLSLTNSPSRRQELWLSREAGVRYLRRDFHWHRIEPVQGRFDFGDYDRMVDEARDYGIRFIGLLVYGNPWAYGEPGRTSSIDPGDFGAYVGRTVAHFKDRIKLWEIWNEPNLHRFWEPEPDPAAFGALVKAAYRAAKAADPDCQVALGGLSSLMNFLPDNFWGFLRETYRHHPDLGDYFDVLAIHPYTFLQSAMPEEPVVQGSLVQSIRQARSIMADHQDGDKPIWITEMGWPACPEGAAGCPPAFPVPNVTHAQQARFLARAFILSLSEQVALFCWYDFMDGRGLGGGLSSENYFGLVQYDGAPDALPGPVLKPAYQAYQTLSRLLGDTYWLGDMKASLNLREDEEGHLFSDRSAGKMILALWKTGEDRERTLRLSIQEPGYTFDQVSLLGRSTPLSPRNNILILSLGNDPVYLRITTGQEKKSL